MHRYATLAAFVPLVAAHGFIRTPAPRQPGDAYKAACGDQPFNQQSADINGNVQGILQVVGNDLKAADCNLWLCKGFQFDDNKANVQSYSLGEKIDFDINIAAPHTGIANVSVVKTSSNSIIGTPLIEFTNYASNAGVAANNSAFSVTLPDSLDGECTTAGDCVLQWYWDAADINQTYESCVDFTVSGSGSGSGPAPSKPETPAASSAPATDAAPAPTSATEIVTSAISPKPTSTPAPEDPAEDDDECPADDDDEEEGDDDDEDDECPADEEDGQDTENPVEDDDEECPADEEDEDEDEGDDEECPADEDDDEEGDYSAPPSAPTLTNKVVEPTNKPSNPQPPKDSNKPSKPEYTNKPSGPRTTFSTIIREVTITKEAPTVTVTAPASAECTTA